MQSNSRARFILLSVSLVLAPALTPAAAQSADTESAESGPPVAAPGSAASLNHWFGRAAKAYAEEDHVAWVEALEHLHRLRPFNYDFMRQLVIGYALTDQKPKAFDMMIRMQQQGLAADWDRIEALEPLRQFEVYDYVRDLMDEAGAPAGDAAVEFTIPPAHAMPEAVARDEATGRTFIGTVRDGEILVHEPGADDLRRFAGPDSVKGLMAVFDLLADSERGHLWVATGSTSQYVNARPALFGRTGLIKLDLNTGEKLGEYRVLPDGNAHLLGALDQAADGTLFAADSASPLIYRLAPGDDRPQPYAGHPMFTSFRGIALSPDAERLYVADYDLGLFFFDLTAEQPRGYSLGVPPNLNLGGIDGLFMWNNHLVVVQNGVTPQRVLRLELDATGRRVTGIATVAKALEQFENPTYGALDGGDLLLLARSHWQRVDGEGRPIDPPLPDVPVLRLSVAEALEVVVGERLIEQIKQQAGQPPEG